MRLTPDRIANTIAAARETTGGAARSAQKARGDARRWVNAGPRGRGSEEARCEDSGKQSAPGAWAYAGRNAGEKGRANAWISSCKEENKAVQALHIERIFERYIRQFGNNGTGYARESTGARGAIHMTASEEVVLKDARAATAAFRRTFGCELRPESLAEVYVASRLNLTLIHGNNPGFDGTAPNGDRYQIKYRASGSIVDMNNFEFDYMVLVNMNVDYEVTGMYRVAQQQVRDNCTHREKYRRWQISQAKFIDIADRLA